MRKLIGGIAIVLGLCAYAAAAVTLGNRLPDHWLVHLLFYPVAGILWVWPAARVVRWAQAQPGTG